MVLAVQAKVDKVAVSCRAVERHIMNTTVIIIMKAVAKCVRLYFPSAGLASATARYSLVAAQCSSRFVREPRMRYDSAT